MAYHQTKSSNKVANKEKGIFGEKLAQAHLKKGGYEILYTNWTCRWGEIDVVARLKNELIFVEVKYRASDRLGEGYEAVNYHKKRSLYRAINKFFVEKKIDPNVLWRFDVICITGSRLVHFEAVEL
jgi:putative endonuclease